MSGFIKKMDKKVLKMLMVVGGIILILIIAIIVVAITSGGKNSYSKIERNMVNAAKAYYRDNSNSLPKEIGDTVEVDTTTLVSGEYIKDLSEYTDENVVCNGKVIVAKLEKDYDYVASLDCGDSYKTEFLADKLIKNTVTTGNGLYKTEDFVKQGSPLGIDDEGYDLSTNELMSGYVYRGEIVNNYIKLDDELYRIIKIDGNNDIMVITENLRLKNSFDDRYNSEVSNTYGINDYTMSRAYEKLSSSYQELKDDSFIKKKIVPKNVCIGKRSNDDTATDGSIECSTVMKKQYISLVPLFDVMNASLDPLCEQSNSNECMNYNYIVNSGKTFFWTLTASNDNTYDSFIVSNEISTIRSNRSASLRYVFYLSNRLIYSKGTGTEEDPYIVK